MERKALIHALYQNPISPERIEEMSFEAIDRETPRHRFNNEEWVVVRRMIHTTANFGLAEAVRFSPGAIDAAVAALRAGKPVYCDSNMIRSGISQERLKAVCPSYAPQLVACHVADEDVKDEAKKQGLPRSLYAVRKAKERLDGGIAIFGNAPVALMELNRMILEEGVRPALVIGMPVGFVHVVESKDELFSLPVPAIILQGRMGGSPLAVSVLHALCAIALERKGNGR